MSYLLEKLADKEPQDNNIDVASISDVIEGTPAEGEILVVDGNGVWSPQTGPSFSEVSPHTLNYASHGNGSSYSATAYAFSTTNYAYQWYTTATRKVIYSGVSELASTKPPAPIANSVFPAGLTLSAGTYLIKWITGYRGTGCTFRLMHSNTSNTDIQYFGNVGRFSSTGKTGSMVVGVVTLTTTRRVRVAFLSGNAQLGSYLTQRCQSMIVERIS